MTATVSMEIPYLRPDGTLTFEGMNLWQQVIDDLATLSGATISLDGLSDVTITTPATGQVLGYNGTAWVNQTIGAGRFLLATKTASASATLDFTEFANSTYRLYEFELENIIPATDSVTLWMRTSTNGGSTYADGASNYIWGMDGTGSTGAQVALSNADSKIALTDSAALVGNAAAEYGVSGRITMYAAPLAVPTEIIGALNYWRDTGGWFRYHLGGVRNSAADVDAVRFLFSSGNIASGTIRMFGIV